MKNGILAAFITLLISNISIAETQVSEEALQTEHHTQSPDNINYLPSMLPVIINNSDVIELTETQVDTLQKWQQVHRKKVAEKLNKIKHKHIAIKEAAISPNISSARLKQMQTEIFRLQRDVLEDKLLCRELVIKTFNRDNWDGFFLVLADQAM